jgi:phage baseplate assembly protein W
MTGPRLDPARAIQDPNREPRGFGFPFRFDPLSGGIAWAEGPEKLHDNVMHLLQTTPGERVMRRTYGAGLRDLVQDPNDDVLRALAQHRIGQAIAENEPRIRPQRITVQADSADPAQASVVAEIAYEIRRSHQQGLMHVPLSAGGL